jgi:protease-4
VNTVRGFVEALRRASRDNRVRAVLLMPSSLDLPYWGKVQEMRDAVVAFRKSGKKVTAFLEFGGDREYYLASAADRVFLMPTSSLDLTGVASYEMFLRGTLDKIGAYPDFVHIGDYKTAPNQLTQKGFTPAHREMAQSLNRDMYEQLVAGIAEGRKKNENDIRDLLDKGPFVAKDALEAGLVDELAYEDELDDRVPELGDRDAMRRIEGGDYQRVSPQAAGLRPRSRIALLYVVGTIVSGKSGFDAVNGSVVGSETIIEQIRKIRDDESIKAIVLRIDSPGGSSVASDVIWRELTITREEKPNRPIVTSMADLAASGGYYIAMPTETIVAQPGTLTGSIGIYGGKITTAGTYQKLGMSIEAVSSGRHAEMNSPVRPYTESERAKMDEQLRAFYTQFVQKVAESRGMSPDKVDSVAQGRVWTGRQAKEIGLVDELGGFETAIKVAKRRAKIADSAEVELVTYPSYRGVIDMLTQQFGRSAHERLLTVAPDFMRLVAPFAMPFNLFRRGEAMAILRF